MAEPTDMTGMAGLTARLVEHGQRLAALPLPDDAVRMACHSLLDWYAVAHAGWREPPVAMLCDEVQAEGGHPRATLLDGTRVSAVQAALVNGTASHVLDFDDAHLESRVHPSVPLWPAILAQAEERGLSGGAALAAFVAGVEMQSNVASLMGEGHYARGWHNTATLGTLGAAAAVALLDGLDTPRTCHALSIAATRAGGMRALFGTMCKPLHAGQAAAMGLQSARLAGRGFTGVEDIVERQEGFAELYGDTARFGAALDAARGLRLGGIVFKYHASCYGTQAPIDAALLLREQAPVRPRDITRIEVTVEQQYTGVCCIAEPRSVSEARFSIAHMVALVLAGRSTVDAASFAPAMRDDPEVAALRARVVTRGSDAMPRAHAEVRLVRADGSSLARQVDASRPERDLDRQEARLRDKAMVLLAPRVGTARAQAVVERILGFQDEASVAVFMATTPAASSAAAGGVAG
ncbi:MAG: MmgE/PrpD family protein [Pseudomonadota bacterium]